MSMTSNDSNALLSFSEERFRSHRRCPFLLFTLGMGVTYPRPEKILVLVGAMRKALHACVRDA